MEFPMNTLNIIRKQIEKAEASRRAQLSHCAYRGNKCEVHVGGEPVHGTFVYRGRTYTRWVQLNNCLASSIGRSFFCSLLSIIKSAVGINRYT